MNIKLLIGAALLGAFILGSIVSGFGIAQQSDQAAPAEAAAPGPQTATIEPATPEITSRAPVETDFTTTEEDDIRKLVEEYILENPEVLIESLNNFQQRERVAAAERLQAAAANNLSELINGDGGFSIAANQKNAKIAVIELFDYHCGYCKRATGLVQDLAQNDADVMVVFREYPILRQESLIAAEYALAARAQDKYVDLHFAMMNAQGTLTESRIKDIAADLEIDMKALEKARKDPAITTAIERTRDIAREMGADGTPTFIVASMDGEFVEVMPGFSAENLQATIKEAKKVAG